MNATAALQEQMSSIKPAPLPTDEARLGQCSASLLLTLTRSKNSSNLLTLSLIAPPGSALGQ